jgi:hypothetical protein
MGKMRGGLFIFAYNFRIGSVHKNFLSILVASNGKWD